MSPDVWAVWPTVNIERSQNMIEYWHALGYKVAILINPPCQPQDLLDAECVVVQYEWQGFPKAGNILCRTVTGDIVVVVGDDVFPDPIKDAREIGDEFLERFPDLFGVMQPTGDKYAWTHKCAVSPWIGRGFIERAYDGKGPFWEGYYHYFSDQELQEYATEQGAFQQREDITQFHDHWQRKDGVRRPSYLMEAKRRWRGDKQIFEARKAKGFPSDGTY